jgi:hypothetical protein
MMNLRSAPGWGPFAKVSTLFLVLLSTSINVGDAQVVSSDFQDCLSGDNVDLSVDYFPSKYVPREYIPNDFLLEAQDFADEFKTDETTDLFTITYHNHYKIITNNFVNKTYLLHLCGTEPPVSELDGRHHLVLPVPHKGGLAITSTTQIPY